MFAPIRGDAAIPDGARWLDKPRGQPYPEFLASLPETTIWQRQLVLGPAPELCLAVPASAHRRPIAPAN